MTLGDLPMEIFWSFQGGPLGSHLGLKTSPLGSRVSVLVVEPVSPSNEGGEYPFILAHFNWDLHGSELFLKSTHVRLEIQRV